MKPYAKPSIRLALLVATITLITGCATSREVVAPKVDSGINPSQGIAVRIEKIEDARRFEVKPTEPSIPSLMDDNIADPILRSRAIARKRNAYGMALGDVLLPEGQSVVTLTESAVARSFREAGYRVVSSGDPEYAQAVPITTKIDKLWAWFNPGFWSIALESNFDIAVSAPISAVQQPAKISGQARTTMQLATADDWSNIIKKALDEFALKLKEKLLTK